MGSLTRKTCMGAERIREEQAVVAASDKMMAIAEGYKWSPNFDL